MGKFKPVIDIPKNVKITEEFIKENREEVEKTMKYFLLYPDLYLDMITPSYSNFKLFFYQRINKKSPFAPKSAQQRY